MLCELKVENLALIESLHLRFDAEHPSGLIVMTGETGAGKSIMLRAIKMLTGGRSQSDWVRSGTEQCSVEALFEISSDHTQLLQKLVDAGFGEETTIIIKRVVTVQGRSRLYVNGSLATAKIVREITDHLLNVASQHDHQQLLQSQLHLDFLDTLGDHWPERFELAKVHSDYHRCLDELTGLQQQEQDKEQKKDFLQFQLDEIRQHDLEAGEDEALENEKKKLKSADNLIKLSQESFGVMSSSILDNLSGIRKNMEAIAAIDPDASELAEEVSGYCFQAEDLASALREYRDSLDNDPYRLEKVTERIDIIQGLKRKYGSTIEEIFLFAENADKELAHLASIEVQLEDLQIELDKLGRELLTNAKKLTQKRKVTSEKLEKAMASELSSLAFHQAEIAVKWQNCDESVESISQTGWDKVEFFFSANPGEPSRPLAKVASGGELSRLMLAFKCILARKDMVDTVFFDEVDAGIGGEAAEAVARKITELASHHQVFCITHLPQIAARGTNHFLVQKGVNGGRTSSSIDMLDDSSREKEVARMLAGDSVTDQTRAWARELLTKG